MADEAEQLWGEKVDLLPIGNALMADEAEQLWGEKVDLLPPEEFVRCNTIFYKYTKLVRTTSESVWEAVQSKTPRADATSSISYLRAIEGVPNMSFREELLTNLLQHVRSVDDTPVEDSLFIEILKLNNTTSMHIWAVLWGAVSSAESHVLESDPSNETEAPPKAIQAHVMLFDLSRHGLYFEGMDTVTTATGRWTPSGSERLEQAFLMQIWEHTVGFLKPVPIGDGSESDRATEVAIYLQDIVSSVNRQSDYYGGNLLLPLCARLAFRTKVGVPDDSTSSQLMMVSDFVLRMIRIPIFVVFSTNVINTHKDVDNLCASQRQSIQESMDAIAENMREAVDRRKATTSTMQDEYSDQSACAVPVMTYDRVCDRMWLCCILTFVHDDNGQQSSASDQSTLVESLKTVPKQYQSWDGLFKALIKNVFSTSLSEKVVDAVYNTNSDEYVLYVSIEQIVTGDDKTLDRDIAMRNTRATTDVSSDYEPYFGQLGLMCVRERWAVSPKPLKHIGSKLLFPTLTLGRLLEVAKKQSDCFSDKFNEETGLLELLRGGIDTECELVNDPVTTNIFNIIGMFSESPSGVPISIMTREGDLFTESELIASILHDITSAVERDETDLFNTPMLESMSNAFSTTAKTMVQNDKALYLSRWKHPALDSDPTQYEWNLRLKKYRDPGRYSSLYYNSALLDMAKLHNTYQIVETAPPCESNSILATCIGEIRKFSAGVKAALAILKPLRDMLAHQAVVQSRSTRVGKTGISDVVRLKENVSRLVKIVEQIDTSVSKQYLRVCDACESFHGRIESSIPTLSLIDRIDKTLKSVKALLSDPSLRGILSSISTVCTRLLSSGNMNMYSSKLRQAHNWTPKFENDQSVFARDDIDAVYQSEDVVNSVTEWERVYSDVYKPLVVRALLHMVLSEDDVVSVPIERPDRVLVGAAKIDNVVSADEREAAEEQEKLAYQQRVEAQNRLYREIVDIDSATTERLQKERMFGEKKREFLNLMNEMYNTVESHQRQPSGKRFIDREEYNDLLNNRKPPQESPITTRVEWIVNCDNFVMGVPIPNKDGNKFPVVGIRRNWKNQYETFKQVYRELITVLCDVVAQQLDIYAHLFPESVEDPTLPKGKLEAVRREMRSIGSNPELEDNNMVLVMSTSYRVIEAYLTGSDYTNETPPSHAILNALASIPEEYFDGKQVWTDNRENWSRLADQLEWLALMRKYAVDEVNQIVGDASFSSFAMTLQSLYNVMLTLISTWSKKILKVRELESSLRS